MARPLRALAGSALALGALTLSLTVPLTVVAPAADAAPGDVVVQESFDGASLPAGWRALSGSWAGEAAAGAAEAGSAGSRRYAGSAGTGVRRV